MHDVTWPGDDLMQVLMMYGDVRKQAYDQAQQQRKEAHTQLHAFLNGLIRAHYDAAEGRPATASAPRHDRPGLRNERDSRLGELYALFEQSHDEYKKKGEI